MLCEPSATGHPQAAPRTGGGQALGRRPVTTRNTLRAEDILKIRAIAPRPRRA